MLTEKGELQIGIEYKGKIHKDFEIRPQLVRDSVDALESQRAQKNDAYFGLCILSRQMEKLGTIPKEDITPELLMGLHEEDMKIFHKARGELSQKLLSFRGEDKRQKTANTVAP